MYFSKADIKSASKTKRLKLINGVTGIKPGNMIGTRSKSGVTNLAVFSSITHLGSDPALLGFILRPHTEVRRDTYQNILETGVFTINHIHRSFTQRAHYSSAKLDADESEFDLCGFTEEYVNDFEAPFVKESRVKIGLNYIDSVEIEANHTLMVIGEICHLVVPDSSIDEQGYLDLAALGSVGIGGLNSYYELAHRRDYPYVRLSEWPDAFEDFSQNN